MMWYNDDNRVDLIGWYIKVDVSIILYCFLRP
jgi:hypothetical protein